MIDREEILSIVEELLPQLEEDKSEEEIRHIIRRFLIEKGITQHLTENQIRAICWQYLLENNSGDDSGGGDGDNESEDIVADHEVLAIVELAPEAIYRGITDDTVDYNGKAWIKSEMGEPNDVSYGIYIVLRDIQSYGYIRFKNGDVYACSTNGKLYKYTNENLVAEDIRDGTIIYTKNDDSFYVYSAEQHSFTKLAPNRNIKTVRYICDYDLSDSRLRGDSWSTVFASLPLHSTALVLSGSYTSIIEKYGNGSEDYNDVITLTSGGMMTGDLFACADTGKIYQFYDIGSSTFCFWAYPLVDGEQVRLQYSTMADELYTYNATIRKFTLVED